MAAQAGAQAHGCHATPHRSDAPVCTRPWMRRCEPCVNVFPQPSWRHANGRSPVYTMQWYRRASISGKLSPHQCVFAHDQRGCGGVRSFSRTLRVGAASLGEICIPAPVDCPIIPAMAQVNGRSPVWMRLCSARLSSREKAAPQLSQANGFSPVCVREWVSK